VAADVAETRLSPAPPSLAELAELIERGDGADRAFVDAMLRLSWSRTTQAEQRGELSRLHEALSRAALACHAPVRAQIAAGTLRGPALRRHFEAVPAPQRDHFVEEVLGVAYPPLEERPLLTSEHMPYAPSGYEEITHAFDLSELGPSAQLLDLGSGMGKVVMLATLLTGAKSVGVEVDDVLCARAQQASEALGVGAVLLARDAREVDTLQADVVFLYLPFAGAVLTRVLRRLSDDARRRPAGAQRRFLCTGPLAATQHPELRPVGPARAWLQVYAWR
jgi:hypothetical protein